MPDRTESNFVRPPALPTPASRELTPQIAAGLLAPVFAHFLLRLDAHLRYAARGGTRVLYVSRAGVRIRRLYADYLAARGATEAEGAAMLWTSRCLAAKVAWNRAPAAALKVIAAQFPRNNLREACAALLHSSGQAQEALACTDAELDVPAAQLAEFLRSPHRLAATLSGHMREQGALFDRHLGEVTGGASRVLLVDSGWQGTTQGLLRLAYPQTDWSGLYFGIVGSPAADRDTLQRCIGLMFASGRFDPQRPATAFVLYRHLIEWLLEPHGRSVEHLVEDPRAGVAALDAREMLEETPSPEADPLFVAVSAYLRERSGAQGPARIEQEGLAAMRELGRVLAFPTRREALALGTYSMLDFGRSQRVPVLTEPGNPEDGEHRIRAALWLQGQIALEYAGRMLRVRQRAQLGIPAPAEDLFPAAPPRPALVLPHPAKDEAAVAIVMRMVDRPQFLRRALASVGRQTFRDYLCVVVCDGGDFSVAMEECVRAAVDPRRLLFAGNPVSRGMEAASNLGIRALASEFVAVHDDDDTWEPDFLQRTVDYLRGAEGARYGGVVTMSTHVSEIASPVGPIVKRRLPFRGDFHAVRIMDMACANMFPPIAFVYRRSLFERLGGYNEALPVLGDWEFNLRFLLEADIGVLPDRLANYHLRDLLPDAAFGNSIVADLPRHWEYDALVRNALFRSSLASGKTDGALIAIAQVLGELRTLARKSRGPADEHTPDADMAPRATGRRAGAKRP